MLVMTMVTRKNKKITFYPFFPTCITIDTSELHKLLPNKMALFYPTDFYLLGKLLRITQNHSKTFKTIESKKADFSALSKPFKIVENH